MTKNTNIDDYNFGRKSNDDFRFDLIKVQSKSKSRESKCQSTNSVPLGYARPMTAISGAGYQIRSTGALLNNDRLKSNQNQELLNKSPNMIAKEMEEYVHQAIEQSSEMIQKGEHYIALETAKGAKKEACALFRHREMNFLPITPLCRELMCGCMFHLAAMFVINDMKKEALETYASLLKEKSQRHLIANIRVNMGNIYYSVEDYLQAVKMFRMALDRVPRDDRGKMLSIRRSIGNALTKIGEIRDAIRNYENVANLSVNIQSCFNLFLCYVQIGDMNGAKYILLKAINSDKYKYMHEVKDANNEGIDLEKPLTKQCDHLEFELQLKEKKRLSLIHTASRLVTRMFKDHTWVDGYLWVHQLLQTKHCFIALKIQNEQAIEHLHRNEFDAANQILRSYEKKDIELRAMAATNLCFIYSMEGKYENAQEYADVAVDTDRYSSGALVNKGNLFYIKEDYIEAKKVYLEATKHHPDCVEALFNLGLVNIRLDLANESFKVMEKLYSTIQNDPHVLYHVASLYEQQQDADSTVKWFHVLSASLPSDPKILSRLGNILSEDSQCFHYHSESYRMYHSSLNTIRWMAVWYAKHKMYEKAAHYIAHALQIQPKEVKWNLMLTSCTREDGKLFSRAIKRFQNDSKI